jgi:hypothetical protein
MTVYTFILRETAENNDHPHHLGRRQQAMDYATAKGCTMLDDPKELMVKGVWHYWWFIDIPNAQALADIVKQFTVTNTYVEFAVDPVQPK